MRMWMVEPRFLCRQHLLGEHVELHMAVGAIRKAKNLTRFFRDGFLETASIQRRHEELAQELVCRGYRHNSPLVYRDLLNKGKVDTNKSERDLKLRCSKCYR